MRSLIWLVRVVNVRHLTERRLRTSLTAGGVAAGVALLAAIGSMNATLVETVRSTATAFASPADLQVTGAVVGGLHDDLPAQLAEVPGVAEAIPVLLLRTEATADGRTQGAFIVGTTLDGMAEDGLVLSHALADRLDVAAGDELALAAPTGSIDLTVDAVATTAELERINGGMVAALPLADAQRLFGRPDRIDLVLIVADDAVPLDRLQADLADAVGGAGSVTRPEDAPGASNANVDPFVALTDAVGLISLFVALMLVFNTMSMAMAERRRELSLARAVGATPRQLFVAALAESAVIGVAGTAIGLGVGILLTDVLIGAAGDAYRTVLPVDAPDQGGLHLAPLLLAGGVGLTVSVLASVLPARRALQAAPIDALRPNAPYESTPVPRGRPILLALTGTALLAVGVLLGAAFMGPSRPPALAGLAVVAILAGVTFLLPGAVPLAAELLAAGLRRGWGTPGRLAGDALRANPRRTTLTTATLLLPLATVVAMGTAFGSAEAKFTNLAETFVTFPIAVNADSFVGYTASQPLPVEIGTRLADVEGVRAALPYQNVFVTVDGQQSVLYVAPVSAAVDVGLETTDAELAEDPDAFRSGLEEGQIAVSTLASGRLAVEAGDELVLPTPSGPRGFPVATVFEDLAGSPTIYIDRATYVAHWGDTGAGSFAVVPEDGVAVTTVVARLERLIELEAIPAQVLTRQEAVDDLTGALTEIFSIARSIQLAALIVGGLTLASTAFTTVLERRWTLGLQRTLGMSRRQIGRSLVLESLAIGILGAAGATVVGLAMGSLLAYAFGTQVGSSLDVVIPWTVVTISSVAGLVIALLATLQPRRAATRTPIIEALRVD